MFVIYCIKLKFLNKFNTWGNSILTIVLSLHKIDIAFTNSFIFSTCAITLLATINFIFLFF